MIHLFYYEDYSTRQIAAVLHKPEATIRSDLHRGRARIPEHLTDCDLQETSEKHPIRHFPVWGRYLSIAACLALLLLAARILPGLSFTTQPDVSESLTAVNGITEVSSSAELSAAVGFPVAEVTDCPFPAVLWYRG